MAPVAAEGMIERVAERTMPVEAAEAESDGAAAGRADEDGGADGGRTTQTDGEATASSR